MQDDPVQVVAERIAEIKNKLEIANQRLESAPSMGFKKKYIYEIEQLQELKDFNELIYMLFKGYQ